MLRYYYNLCNNIFCTIQKIGSFTLIYFIIKKIFFEVNDFNKIKNDKSNKLIKNNSSEIKNNSSEIKNNSSEIQKNDDEIINNYNQIMKSNKLKIINNCYICKKNINNNNSIFCFDSEIFCKIICRDNYIKNIFMIKHIKNNN